MSASRSLILGTGMYVPSQIVTNKDLEKIMDTSDEWIQQRSGIKERRWATKGEDTTCNMAVKASRQAIQNANLQVDDIDAIIFGCLVSDYVFPGTGVLLQRELGFKKTVPALDIRNQCSGFLYAMSVADAWIRSGMYKKVLIVGSEIHSTTIDQSTRGRNVTVLFGDGAGAMVLSATNESNYIIDTRLHSEGAYAEKLAITKPSSNDFPRINSDTGLGLEVYPVMDGRLVFKHAVERMNEVMQEILAVNNITADDLDFLVAHQANARINQNLMSTLGLAEEKTYNTIDRYGNTTMATIPITFHEATEKKMIKRGDLISFVAFGAGFTWGASLIRY